MIMATINPSENLWQRLSKVLTLAELETLIEYIEAVKEDGFGGVSLEIDNHHPSKIKITGNISRLLSKLKPKSYKPE